MKTLNEQNGFNIYFFHNPSCIRSY
jgi:hypothetical protein